MLLAQRCRASTEVPCRSPKRAAR
ncbi:hypothetical protein PSPO01_16123 [Paraphaeosphaeria sporulosa]